jgi:DNA segregation ATPase FtsK/SpoIIIE, S-DNA-T family
MATIPFHDRQRQALQELVELSAWRARAEVEVAEANSARTEASDRDYHSARERIQRDFEQARHAAENRLADEMQRVTDAYEQDKNIAAQANSSAQHKARYLFTITREKIEADFKESRWTISTVYDSDKKVAKEQRAKMESRAESAVNKIAGVHQDARMLLVKWKLDDLIPEPAVRRFSSDFDPFQAMQQCQVLAQTRLQEMQAFPYPRFLRRFPWMVAVVWLIWLAPAFLFDGWYFWAAGVTLVTFAAGWFVRAWLKKKCRALANALYQGIAQAHADAEGLHPRCRRLARQTYKKNRLDSKKRNQENLRQAIKKCKKQLRQCTADRDRAMHAAQKVFKRQMAEIERRRDIDREQAETESRTRLKEIESSRDDALARIESDYRAACDANNRRHAAEWTELLSTWKQGLDRFQALVSEVDEICRRLYPPWSDPAWAAWQPPVAISQGVRFGELEFAMERVPDGLPADPQLPPLDLHGLSFPALLGFPGKASLLFKVQDDGRPRAVAALQGILLRWLTGLPPGKVRCTILDPVGRGENFAAFMHLADYDEQLVAGRIWTEPVHMDQRLADLTVHMENVIQKYLRNQFKTLEEYNEAAGEVAEPFRVVVVANFPVNFTHDACRRLVSLAASGAPCGVYTLITVDTRQPLPQGFDLKDLEQACTVLEWQNGGFQWRDEDFGRFPLELEKPAGAEFATRILHTVGREAKRAGRVEVPFDYVAPSSENWWTSDSRECLAVPLGRAGATGKQFLQLGQGTAQHALVGGKTGSGKSTLLHALITQLALYYSPDEVELYLIDFKKGVEFKTYAVHELPHARVVAIESEREFGLSVLQRLDAELKTRGERFRHAGVNDLHAYREVQAQGNGTAEPMPRILLIVDEFQEFFVEDDKVGQEAAQLLDRLVRQGRAFGVHVLLGSQTIGGAYSLARSTIDQMAVRIALQCSEADGHLILGKDNPAARLLSRPGEAIYNAAGGLLEGNNLFQVVWLDDDQRDSILDRVTDLARRREFTPRQRQIVFEGTAPSDLRRNLQIERLWHDDPPVTAPPVLHAWLGEAVAIKDPTAAFFRRQSGANVLMVGQQDAPAFRMMVSSMISLAAQLPPRASNPSFLLVVGSPLEMAEEKVLAALPDIMQPLLQVVQVRDLPKIIGDLSAEVDQRLKTPVNADPVFLFLYGLQRLRDLRKPEDEFSFGRRGEDKANTAKQFVGILRDGPIAGVFTIAWCDNLNNLNRVFDRPTLREFDMRVLGQMSAADSSNLIDSPTASKLGMHRALFCTEDQAHLEKFRPYGLPDLDFLEQIRERLRQRGAGAAELATSGG